MDQILMESCKSSEVLKCIIVGLLCVQGDLDDRPNMTNVILMLSGDIVTLPSPKEPAFIPGRDYVISSSSSSSKTNTQSKNMLTITKLDGRWSGGYLFYPWSVFVFINIYDSHFWQYFLVIDILSIFVSYFVDMLQLN